MTVCGQKWPRSAAVNSSSGGFPNRPLGNFCFYWAVGASNCPVGSLVSPSGQFCSTNSGGSGDFPNFLFQDTLYFGILLTSLGASWFKKQANRPLLIKNKTRSAAREERETRKITPARFLVLGGLPNPPLQTPRWAAGGLKGLSCSQSTSLVSDDVWQGNTVVYNLKSSQQ